MLAELWNHIPSLSIVYLCVYVCDNNVVSICTNNITEYDHITDTWKTHIILCNYNLYIYVCIHIYRQISTHTHAHKHIHQTHTPTYTHAHAPIVLHNRRSSTILLIWRVLHNVSMLELYLKVCHSNGGGVGESTLTSSAHSRNYYKSVELLITIVTPWCVTGRVTLSSDTYT